jgi:hypothetical protein
MALSLRSLVQMAAAKVTVSTILGAEVDDVNIEPGPACGAGIDGL